MPGRRSESRPATRDRHAPLRAFVALAVGLLLLSGGWRTYASWTAGATVAPSSPVSSGHVSLTPGSTKIELHSQVTPKVAGTPDRFFASSTTCTTAAPYYECRDVTSTLGSERLAVGDRLVITRQATLTGAGTNLRGNLTVDASKVVNRSAAACPTPTASLVCAASYTAQVTTPSGTVSTLPASLTGSLPINLRSATTGLGTYTLVWTMSVPASNGANRWDTQLLDQAVTFGPLTAAFTQTS